MADEKRFSLKGPTYRVTLGSRKPPAKRHKPYLLRLSTDTWNKWQSCRISANSCSNDGFASVLLDAWRVQFKENIGFVPRPKKKKYPIFLRNVATQTKHRKQMETGTQSVLTQRDINAICGKYNNALDKMSDDDEDRENSVVNNRRWRCLRSMLGCSQDTDVANVLMDWFVDTSPLIKMSSDDVTFALAKATDTAARKSKSITVPYLLTLRVTRDQELSIQTLCTLKGWKFDPIRPVDITCMEGSLPNQWKHVQPLGDPFKYKMPPPGQKPEQLSRPFKFQSYNPRPKQTKTSVAPHIAAVSTPAGSGQIQTQTGQSEEGPLCMFRNKQGQIMFVRLPQQSVKCSQQTSLPMKMTQTIQASTVNLEQKQSTLPAQADQQQSEASNVNVVRVVPKQPIVNPGSKAMPVYDMPNYSNRSSVTWPGGAPVSSVTMSGRAPVSSVTMSVDAPVSPVLVSVGAPVSSVTMSGRAPVSSVTMSGRAPVSSVTMPGSAPVSYVTMPGSAPVSSVTMSGGAPVSSVTMSGGAPVSSVTMPGSAPVSYVTMSGGAPVSSMTVSGRAPVSSVTMSGRAPVSSVTVSGSAPVSSVTMSGRAPVYFVTMPGRAPVSSVTVSGSAPVSSVTMSGRAPVYFVTMPGRAPVSSVTMPGSAPVSSVTMSGSAPVSSVTMSGSAPVSSVTMSGSAPVSSVTMSGRAPVSSVTMSRRAPVSSVTMSGRAPVSSVTMSGRAPVSSVTMPGSAPESSVTMSGGASVSSVTMSGSAPVSSVTMSGGAPVSSVTMSGGAPVSSVTMSGSAPVSSVTVSGSASVSSVTMPVRAPVSYVAITTSTPVLSSSASSVVTKQKTALQAATGFPVAGGMRPQRPVIYFFHNNSQVSSVSMCDSATSMTTGISYLSGSSGSAPVSSAALTSLPANNSVFGNSPTTSPAVFMKDEPPEVENCVTSEPVSVQQSGSVTTGTSLLRTSASSVVIKQETDRQSYTHKLKHSPENKDEASDLRVSLDPRSIVPVSLHVNYCHRSSLLAAPQLRHGLGFTVPVGPQVSHGQRSIVPVTLNTGHGSPVPVGLQPSHDYRSILPAAARFSHDQRSYMPVALHTSDSHGSTVSLTPQVSHSHGSIVPMSPCLPEEPVSAMISLDNIKQEICMDVDNIKQEISMDVISELCDEPPTLEQQVQVSTNMSTVCAEPLLDKVKEEFPLPVTTNLSNLTSVAEPGAGLSDVFVKQEVEDMATVSDSQSVFFKQELN